MAGEWGIKASFEGNAGGSAEVRMSAKGNPWAQFSVAVYNGTEKDGTKITEWVRVTAFGDNAEMAGGDIGKGTVVRCEGKLFLERYTDRDNVARISFKMTADSVTVVSGKKQGDAVERQAPKRSNDYQAPLEQDEIPF